MEKQGRLRAPQKFQHPATSIPGCATGPSYACYETIYAQDGIYWDKMSGKLNCKNVNKRQPEDKTQKQCKAENLFESNRFS